MNTSYNPDVTAEDFLRMLNEHLDNPEVVILDIRTQDEFDTYHIKNAILIDFYQDTFREEINALDKNKTYLIYCRTGRRTGTADNNARDLMLQLGFPKVYNLLGGIHALVKIPEADDIII